MCLLLLNKFHLFTIHYYFFTPAGAVAPRV